jgi:HK97 family phage portal protein
MKNRKNIFQKLGNYLASKVKSVSLTMLPNSGFAGSEDLFDSFNLRTFRESLYLFIGVSMIRETVSSIPLQMYEIKNKEGENVEIFDDPFLDLLERPNDTQTQKEFWKLSIAYYLLAGEAFWYLERADVNAVPTAMMNMRPDAVTILFSADRKDIIGYEFHQNNGQTIKLRTEDVLHIKNIDPINPIRGIGVIRPATQRITTEKEAAKHQANTFKTQGRPDIVVFSENDLTEEAIEDAQEKWAKKFGADKGSQLGMFGNGIKSLQVLGTSPKDMDFMPTMNFLRDDILAALHIPKPMITSDDVNLANSKTARVNYIKEACLPVLDTFIDIINNKFLNDMDQNRFVTYENPVNEDREMLLKEATELKTAGIITIDEARSLMSYDTIDGGDVLAPNSQPTLQMSMRSLKLRKYARQLLKKRPILVKKFKAIEATRNLIEAEKSVKRSRNSVFNTPQLKEMYVKSYHKNIDAKAKGFKQTIDVYNQDFAGRIVKYLNDFGLNSTTFFDVSAEITEAKAIFNPLMLSMYSKIGQETLDNVAEGFATKASEQFFTTEEAKKKLSDRAQFFITSMLNTDYEDLKEVLVQGMKEGAGVDVIGRNIRQYFEDMSVARAKTIARTETGRLVSEATNEAYNQSAIITGKEWITAGDDKVRDEHQMNAGVIVDANGVFPGGEHYPGEASINCRCVLAPAV